MATNKDDSKKTEIKPQEAATDKVKQPPDDKKPNELSQPASAPIIEVIQERPQEFIFSPKRTHGQAGVQMLTNSNKLVEDLKSFSGLDIEILATRIKSGVDAQAVGGEASALLVLIDQEKGREFVRQSTSPGSPIWVDVNHKIYCSGDPLINYYSTSDIFQLSDGGASLRVDIRILGEADKPLPAVVVKLYSSIQLIPINAITNQDGVASFQLPSAIISTIAGIVIEPNSMHWSKIIRNPTLLIGKTNNVRVSSYSEFDNTFFSSGAISWGLKTIGALGAKPEGKGIKVGIIDSGCDASHEMLQHVVKGVDFNRGGTSESWKHDEIGHGTHVAGIIGARHAGQNGISIRGVAPQAELYIYKVFPQGDFFILGGAIEAAVADKVDVINMSLGSRDFSNDIAESIGKAAEEGIPCFVAAGNSGDAVQFPANLTTSIAVSALGLKSAMPADSVSANSLNPSFANTDGLFSPSFTCFGSSIDFAGPGVGVISTVPGNGLRALDGTSMAAPHLAGLAALYFSEESASNPVPKGAARLDYIYNCLRRAAKQMPFGADRTGVGMPTVSAGLPVSELGLRRMVMASVSGTGTSFWVGGGGGFSGGGASGGW